MGKPTNSKKFKLNMNPCYKYNTRKKGNQVEEIWKDIKGYEGRYKVSNFMT